ncbi:hypothetical protein QE424_001174 [Stenotrophomonas rhizophila]|jgi:hypothetical protein|uniref:Uncharacterized protein n=1 Tax=Stenotrophomonas rhizophila TaxID=216778 RepID=A0AAP5AIC4_9GAMM|nr:hypothetical protein BAY15_2593 [Stenotrophomonas rhizophila]MDQ1108015.1 hypothetical protein [Stenotrophomonas rhizophila]
MARRARAVDALSLAGLSGRLSVSRKEADV